LIFAEIYLEVFFSFQGVPYRGDIVDNWSLGVILFVMCCGIMPYRDNNVRLLMLDQKMPLRYGSKLEKTLSDEVKALMQGILNYEMKKRLNLPRIQQYPWVQKGGTPPSPPSNGLAEISKKAVSLSDHPNNTTPSPQAMAVMQELKTQTGK